MTAKHTIIYWFRQDLRVADLPGLTAALSNGHRVIPCYVLDDLAPGTRRMGAASRWWLHHSLTALSAELAELGGKLCLLQGDTGQALSELAKASGASHIYCSRSYEPWAVQLEQDLHQSLAAENVELKRFPGYLLFEPESIRNQSGQPFKVFTPFWKHCLRQGAPRSPLGAPAAGSFWESVGPGMALKDYALLPSKPNWAAGWENLWQPGTVGARAALQRFLETGISDYRDQRDIPKRQATSRLSPHLHFGEISPAQVWQTVRQATAGQPALDEQADKFLSEVGWREFNTHLLASFPFITEDPFNANFSGFPWQQNTKLLHSWQQGKTGYPLVDAGMRELWQTGFMHNRVRMVCASFLTKHLLLHWREGERWFWDTLVDADTANNVGGWQWAAGSGADAAPYFRIFNPTLQGKKFDSDGHYIRRWVPEIAALPDRHLHEPWSAPAPVLAEAGIELGKHYPHPIVDHAQARETALNAYAAMKEALPPGSAR